MLVRGPGLPRQRCRSFVALSALTKREERPGVEPEGAALVLVGRQQLLKRAVVASPQQAAGEEVPDPWLSFGFSRSMSRKWLIAPSSSPSFSSALARPALARM